MNRRLFGSVAVISLAIIFLAGCQSVSDQIGKKMAENIIGQSTGGQVSINDQGGNISIKTKEGEANFGGGAQRPDSVSADLPSLPNARDFGWFGSNQSAMFTFTVDNPSYRDVCASQEALVKAVGWSVNTEGLQMEFEGTKTSAYLKTGYNLSVTCSVDSEKKTTTVTMAKSSTTPASQENQ